MPPRYLRVCLAIYEFAHLKKEKIWANKLARMLRKECSPVTLFKILQRLSDLGVIKSKRELVGKRNHGKILIISEEATETVRELYLRERQDIV